MSKDEINAFLGAGTVYNGRLNFQGSVRIDGTFSGEITSDGTLIVGKDATIEGVLDLGEVIISGHFTGEINARRRIVLHRTACVVGKLRTPSMFMEEGANFEGTLHMNNLDTTVAIDVQ